MTGPLPAHGRSLLAMVNGYRETSIVYALARLGIADELAEGPLVPAELARRTGALEPPLRRVLQGAVILGVLTLDDQGRFGLGPEGNLLRSTVAGSIRPWAILCGEEFMLGWRGLLESARTGRPGFEAETGVSIWQHREERPELGRFFDQSMARMTARTTAAILAAHDFSAHRIVADVGGGNGLLLAAILRANPGLQGVLVDQPHVVTAASVAPHLQALGDRCRPCGADFFASVPAGADAYMLKSVIHDWDDDKSSTILRACREAMDDRACLLLIEYTMPAHPAEAPEIVFGDLHMLAVTGGRERTEAELRALLEAAALRVRTVTRTRAGLSIIESGR